MFALMSVAGSLACGVLRPQPRWSKRTMRYRGPGRRTACSGPQPGARPAVNDQRRLAVRVAADLPVDEVAVADVEHPVVVRLDRRIQLGHLEILAHSE